MSDKIYLWLEDREGKSEFVFWKTMMQQLFPEVVVQSNGIVKKSIVKEHTKF